MGFPFWFIMKLNELMDTFIKILIVENLNEHILKTTFFFLNLTIYLKPLIYSRPESCSRISGCPGERKSFKYYSIWLKHRQ